MIKHSSYNGPIMVEQKKNYFYVIQANNVENSDEGASKLKFPYCVVMGSF